MTVDAELYTTNIYIFGFAVHSRLGAFRVSVPLEGHAHAARDDEQQRSLWVECRISVGGFDAYVLVLITHFELSGYDDEADKIAVLLCPISHVRNDASGTPPPVSRIGNGDHMPEASVSLAPG